MRGPRAARVTAEAGLQCHDQSTRCLFLHELQGGNASYTTCAGEDGLLSPQKASMLVNREGWSFRAGGGDQTGRG